MMRYAIILGSISLLSVTNLSRAADVGALIEFRAGTNARADDVNKNFNDLKSSVNSKQDKAATTCATGKVLQSISDNNVPTCQSSVPSVAAAAGSGLQVTTAADGSATIDTGAFPAQKITGMPGVFFSDAVSIRINSVQGLCSTAAWRTQQQLNLTAPANGYVVVGVTGNVCTYTAGQYVEYGLSSSVTPGTLLFDGFNYSSEIHTTASACGKGEYTPIAFQHIYPVTANTSYSFYFRACRSDTGATGTDGYFNMNQMTGMFFPVRY